MPVSRDSDGGGDYLIVVAEHSPITRERLAALLARESNLFVAGFAGDGRHALRLFENYAPHAVILDLDLPGACGLKLLKRIVLEKPDCTVIALTEGDSFAERSWRGAKFGTRFLFDRTTEYEKAVVVCQRFADRKAHLSGRAATREAFS